MQIQSVIDSNIVPILVDLLKTSEVEVRKEAAWAISNATSGGVKEQIDYLVREDKELLEVIDSKTTFVNRNLLGFYDKKDTSKLKEIRWAIH